VAQCFREIGRLADGKLIVVSTIINAHKKVGKSIKTLPKLRHPQASLCVSATAI
jgi:hypothetical protein